jgi:phosphatidylglycerol:prolipoprotein diacylglycerol transferase
MFNFHLTREYFGFSLQTASATLYKIHWYGVGYLLSYIIIKNLIFRRIKRFGINLTKSELNELSEVSMISGILGGRIWFLVDRYLAEGISPFYRAYQVWEGGMAFQGGLLLGFLAGVIWVLFRRKNLAEISDVVTSCVPVGIMIGRLGNFLNREFMWPVPFIFLVFSLIGISTQIKWLRRSNLWLLILGLSTVIELETISIPSCLFSSITEGLLAFLILRRFFYQNYTIPFKTTTLFFCLYGFFRFINDFFRREINYSIFQLNLKLSQYIAILIIGTSLVLYILTRNLHKKTKNVTLGSGPKKNKEN